MSHEIGNWPRGGSTNVSQDSQRSVNTFISHHSTAASRQNVEVEDQIQFCPKPGQAACSCCLWIMGSLRWAPQVSNGQDKRAMGTTHSDHQFVMGTEVLATLDRRELQKVGWHTMQRNDKMHPGLRCQGAQCPPQLRSLHSKSF